MGGVEGLHGFLRHFPSGTRWMRGTLLAVTPSIFGKIITAVQLLLVCNAGIHTNRALDENKYQQLHSKVAHICLLLRLKFRPGNGCVENVTDYSHWVAVKRIVLHSDFNYCSRSRRAISCVSKTVQEVPTPRRLLPSVVEPLSPPTINFSPLKVVIVLTCELL